MDWVAFSMIATAFLAIALGVLAWIAWQRRQKRTQKQREDTEKRRLAQLETGRQRLVQSHERYPSETAGKVNLSRVSKEMSTLRSLLLSTRWEKADQETLRIMLKVVGREKEGWLDVASIQTFPSEELRVIDQLWLQASNGRFGLSVQKQIWKSIGGNLNADDKIYQVFGDRVGWLLNQTWLQANQLTFALSAPIGHLPAVAVRLGGLSWGVSGFWWDRREAYIFLLSQKDW